MDLLALARRFNLHPEDGVHPSWLPASWPAPHRSPQRLGPGGRAELAKLIWQWNGANACDFDFEAPRRRLGLMDSASLRRLAIYCGFCVHQPLFDVGAFRSQLRRQASRFGSDLADFVVERTPRLPHIVMSLRLPQRHPAGLGRMVVDRGYRLLLAVLAAEGDNFMQRVRYKLPRRTAQMPLLPLLPEQIDELCELIFLCIVPERIPQWDWLF